jgi:hypothetical protein
MLVFALFVRYASGYVSVLTFASAFDRAIEMLTLAREPVTLRVQDYV